MKHLLTLWMLALCLCVSAKETCLMYGLKVRNVDGQPHLCLDSSISTPGSSVDEMLRSWMEQADKLKNGEISKEEYDEWRYKYPELDTYQKRAKVPSQELSDYLVQGLLDKKKK